MTFIVALVYPNPNPNHYLLLILVTLPDLEVETTVEVLFRDSRESQN